MYDRDIPWAFVILVVCSPQYLGTEYAPRCPEPYERTYRAEKVCSSMRKPLINYACLFDVNKNRTNETCDIVADYAPPGEVYFLSGRRTTRPCEPGRYQPFVLWANVSDKCIFAKSLCEEEGQLVASPGSSLTDQTCWCDFRQGYHYITKPKNLCGCVPSVEDCSCYLDLQKQSTHEENMCIVRNAGVQTPLPTKAVFPVVSAMPSRNDNHKANYISTLTKILKILLPIIIVVICMASPVICFTGLFLSCFKVRRQSDQKRKITIAIDLGTTSSVCAYSTASTPNNSDINLNRQWKADTRRGLFHSNKTPTCILFDKDQKAMSIGYKAEDDYRYYADNDEAENYFFVDKFKMELYDKELKYKENMEIKDILGKPICARLVFSQMLLKLKERVMLEDLRNEYQNNDITWVISIPALWGDWQEDFMRKCANRIIN